MNEGAIVRRRHLPHIDVEGHPFFVTACLDGSLSSAGLKEVRSYRQQLESQTPPSGLSPTDWKTRTDKLVFKRIDDLLDGHCPVTHFADNRLAKVVQDAFLHFSSQRYTLLAFVVMPSHHHWLFVPDAAWSSTLVDKPEPRRRPREVISHSIQSYTANQCNRLLEKRGAFWQNETFDHYARDEAEMLRIISYIENNPVKAGLATEPHLYPWSSANLRSQHGIAPGERLPACHEQSLTAWKAIPLLTGCKPIPL